MANVVSLPSHSLPLSRAEAHPKSAAAAAIPWYVWCSVLAVTSAMVGAHWDISWHRSIGRDMFLTPAHIAIYLCGILAGISCGYLILATTYGKLPDLAPASVRVWGFRGPMGAFISAWGGVAMIVSAPFDNWWHNAYGLDVKVLSPPHVVLITGVFAVEMGALVLILGYMNRASGALKTALDWLFLYVGAMILVLMLILTLEYTFRSTQHSALFYTAMSMALPAVLTGVGSASGKRWACTSMAAIYTAFMLAVCWILPLFPAQPKLGPVYNQVTHFVPPAFPLLLIAPAFAIDLLRPRIAKWSLPLRAAVCGLAFLGVFVAAQWPFADFLMSPAARNWFFGSGYFDYLTSHDSHLYRNLFQMIEVTPSEFWAGMARAAAWAMAMSGVGFAWASWMRRVRR